MQENLESSFRWVSRTESWSLYLKPENSKTKNPDTVRSWSFNRYVQDSDWVGVVFPVHDDLAPTRTPSVVSCCPTCVDKKRDKGFRINWCTSQW